jgi:hypothetical protein
MGHVPAGLVAGGCCCCCCAAAAAAAPTPPAAPTQPAPTPRRAPRTRQHNADQEAGRDDRIVQQQGHGERARVGLEPHLNQHPYCDQAAIGRQGDRQEPAHGQLQGSQAAAGAARLISGELQALRRQAAAGCGRQQPLPVGVLLWAPSIHLRACCGQQRQAAGRCRQVHPPG